MFDEEAMADDAKTAMLLARLTLTNIVRETAHRIVNAIDQAEGASTDQLPGQLAELAYAFACLEGAQRGVLPTTPPPPPPPKNSAPAAIPPKQPTSSPQPGSKLPPFGEMSRTNR